MRRPAPAEGCGVEAMYQQQTRSVVVSVVPFYIEDQSSPERGHYVFGYRVRIENRGTETVQLLRRHWRITDALGRMVEVRGDGVVGEQPVLSPGESFEYVSGTPLGTPSGIMVGSYHMVATTTGETFAAAIPAFSLDVPGAAVRSN